MTAWTRSGSLVEHHCSANPLLPEQPNKSTWWQCNCLTILMVHSYAVFMCFSVLSFVLCHPTYTSYNCSNTVVSQVARGLLTPNCCVVPVCCWEQYQYQNPGLCKTWAGGILCKLSSHAENCRTGSLQVVWNIKYNLFAFARNTLIDLHLLSIWTVQSMHFLEGSAGSYAMSFSSNCISSSLLKISQMLQTLHCIWHYQGLNCTIVEK